MASFEEEKVRVEYLLQRRRLTVSSPVVNPNEPGSPDTGVDCVATLTDGRTVGVQVTEQDPWLAPGTRSKEKKLAALGQPYGGFAQNSSGAVLDAICCTIKRKVEIAERHKFDGLSEVWLLICTGIPESPTSTFVPTGPLSPEDLERKSAEILCKSKYHWCFVLSLGGTEKALYQRQRGKVWEKLVDLPDIEQQPRSRYMQDLMVAHGSDDMEEFDRLTQQEVEQTLRNIRRE